MSLVAAAFVAASTLVFPQAAFAEDPTDCAITVVDHSSSELLSGRDIALREQISRLQGLGANVFVRVEENFPSGGDAYYNAELVRCHATLADPADANELRPNIVFVAYGASVAGNYEQRQVVLYVGQTWTDKGINRDETAKIRTNVMRPAALSFKHTEAATFHTIPAALTAGLKRVGDDIADGVPSDGFPRWLCVGLIILVIAVAVLAIIGMRRRGGGGGYYSPSGGYHSTTFVGGSWSDSGSSSSSSGSSGGSTDC
jgi:hypothetical protein